MPKLSQNLKILEARTSDVNAKVEAVVSSVVVTYVFTKYHVYLNPEDEQMLLKCLKLPPNREVSSQFVKSLGEFSDDILR